MTLIEAIEDWYKDESCPPRANELINDSEEPIIELGWQYGEQRRWGQDVLVVFRRGDELVGIQDVEPSTEIQGWGDYGNPSIFEVEAYEVTTTKYRKKR